MVNLKPYLRVTTEHKNYDQSLKPHNCVFNEAWDKMTAVLEYIKPYASVVTNLCSSGLGA